MKIESADLNSISYLDNPKQKMLALAKQFESVFYGVVLKAMRSSVQSSGLISGGNAEDIYTSMLDQEYSKLLAGGQNSSLAEAMTKQLLQLQQSGEEQLPKVDSALPLTQKLLKYR